MNRRFVFLIGILGVSLFAATSLIGGLLIEDYSILSQYISETYAIDTDYGWSLRVFGFVPSGVFITLFCFLGAGYFQSSKLTKIGFYGIGVFYGLATVLVSLFPCDSGCNREFINPSSSQLIHNLVGLLTYLFVPIFMIQIGLGLKNSTDKSRFWLKSMVLGVISILFVFLLFFNQNSEYIGLYQRMVELVFVGWVISCAFTIKNGRFINLNASE